MKRVILLILAAAALCACQPRLIILHTNDTHSHFEPIRGGGNDGLGGIVERAAFVDSVRAAEGADRVLLLDAGDFSQGSSYFSELGGWFEMAILEDLGYDVVTLGNHEFDNDIEALTERVKMLKTTKVVCANLDLSPFELGQYVQPYTIVERGGMKIGIIGMEADIQAAVSATVTQRLNVLDNVEVVNKWETYLHDTEKCDLIILLSHLGYDEDQAIVPSTKYIDLVVGGHTHTKVDGLVYVKNARNRKVAVITDWCWGMEMGKISVY